MKREIALPDPDDRTDADVVVYDGQCRFCTAQVRRLANWDRSGRLAFISLHDARVAVRYPDLTPEMLMQRLYLIDQHERRLGGVAALRYLSLKIPTLWPLAPFLHIPWSLPFWQWGYHLVARHRYLMGHAKPCDDGTCDAHFKG